ncbi:MAG: hypothetical protein HYR66_09425 [Sphingobacteriales bacterium]|nr:hypothetical protein [Sphingobacteriales bacterium]
MFTTKALNYAAAAGYRRTGASLGNLALAYYRKGMYDSALAFAYKSIAINLSDNYVRSLAGAYSGVSGLYARQNNKDSSLLYANKALGAARITGLPGSLQQAYQRLSDAYQLYNKTDSAFKYEKLSNRLNDSLKNARIASLTKYQKFAFDEQQRLKKLDEEKTAYANKMNMLGLVAVLGVILLIAIILFRNNRQKQKASQLPPPKAVA